jgi:DNA-binding MarR family transcriptional regulator
MFHNWNTVPEMERLKYLLANLLFMDQPELLSNLFDIKVLSILKLFMVNDQTEYYLREVAKLTRVSVSSTFRILNRLVHMELLKVREIKTAKLYSLNSGKNTEFLKAIVEVDVVALFVEKASKAFGIDEIFLVGAKEKSKANLLVLGKDIEFDKLKQTAAEMKEKYNFMVNYMTLTREQYEQMFAMGLYPGTKKILYKKA